MPMRSDDPHFKGFRQPQANWSKLPHQLIEQLPIFDALSEVKVTLYILRHTWGYREYGKKKKLTVDDFVNGRKRSNGTRIDNGTGLSEQGVRDGLKRAIDHGFIVCQIDDSDKARIKKYYALNLATAQSLVSEVQSLDPQTLDLRPQTLDPYPLKSVPRTKKETTERNKRKEKEHLSPNGAVVSTIQATDIFIEDPQTNAGTNTPPPSSAAPSPYQLVFGAVVEAWGHNGARAGNIAAMISGISRVKGWKEFNFDPPGNVAGVKVFKDWYALENKSASFPQSPEAIQAWYYRMRTDFQANPHKAVFAPMRAVNRPTAPAIEDDPDFVGSFERKEQ